MTGAPRALLHIWSLIDRIRVFWWVLLSFPHTCELWIKSQCRELITTSCSVLLGSGPGRPGRTRQIHLNCWVQTIQSAREPCWGIKRGFDRTKDSPGHHCPAHWTFILKCLHETLLTQLYRISHDVQFAKLCSFNSKTSSFQATFTSWRHSNVSGKRKSSPKFFFNSEHSNTSGAGRDTAVWV